MNRVQEKDIIDPFEGLSDRESLQLQLDYWVKGISLHNTVRDECCPDFSCCGSKMADLETRKRFEKAYKEKDYETLRSLCVMSLIGFFSGIVENTGKKVHIAGDDPTEH